MHDELRSLQYSGVAEACPGLTLLESKDIGSGWELDFHTAAGVSPLGLLWAEECFQGGTRWAAKVLDMSYVAVDVGVMGNRIFVRHSEPDRELFMTQQGRRVARSANAKWLRTKRFLAGGLQAVAVARDVEASLRFARDYQRRAWRLHFLFMYALKALLMEALEALGDQGSLAADLVASLASVPTSVRVELAELQAAATADDLDRLLRGRGDRFLLSQDVSSLTLAGAIDGGLDVSKFALPSGSRSSRSPAVRPPALPSTALEDANYLWWSEDHYAAVEWRAGIPLRVAATRAAEDLRIPTEDVFFLFWHELLQALRQGGVSDPLSREVSTRRALAESSLPTPAKRPSEVRGVGLTSGSWVGPAKFVRRPEDVGALPSGGFVLLAEDLPSSSYGLIARAGACVIEHGSLLSHSAIICRELNIPLLSGAVGVSGWEGFSGLLHVDADAGFARVVE